MPMPGVDAGGASATSPSIVALRARFVVAEGYLGVNAYMHAGWVYSSGSIVREFGNLWGAGGGAFDRCSLISTQQAVL
jgi:hypothetical protein